jgi:O-phospho-L-seryl-tRNASec:L-selenocysteinyl-tRNA synthase
LLAGRNVSGTRVHLNGKQQTIAGISFQDYGCHTAGYPHPYMNAAAALGGSKQEVDVFVGRLAKAYRELQDRWSAQQAAAAAAPGTRQQQQQE